MSLWVLMVRQFLSLQKLLEDGSNYLRKFLCALWLHCNRYRTVMLSSKRKCMQNIKHTVAISHLLFGHDISKQHKGCSCWITHTPFSSPFAVFWLFLCLNYGVGWSATRSSPPSKPYPGPGYGISSPWILAQAEPYVLLWEWCWWKWGQGQPPTLDVDQFTKAQRLACHSLTHGSNTLTAHISMHSHMQGLRSRTRSEPGRIMTPSLWWVAARMVGAGLCNDGGLWGTAPEVCLHPKKSSMIFKCHNL